MMGALLVWVWLSTFSLMASVAPLLLFLVAFKLLQSAGKVLPLLLMLEWLSLLMILTSVLGGGMSELSLPFMFLVFTLAVSEGSFGLTMLISFHRAHSDTSLSSGASYIT